MGVSRPKTSGLRGAKLIGTCRSSVGLLFWSFWDHGVCFFGSDRWGDPIACCVDLFEVIHDLRHSYGIEVTYPQIHYASFVRWSVKTFLETFRLLVRATSKPKDGTSRVWKQTFLDLEVCILRFGVLLGVGNPVAVLFGLFFELNGLAACFYGGN